MPSVLIDFNGSLHEVEIQDSKGDFTQSIAEALGINSSFAMFHEGSPFKDTNVQPDSLILVVLSSDICEFCKNLPKLRNKKRCAPCTDLLKLHRIEIQPDGSEVYYIFRNYRWSQVSKLSFARDLHGPSYMYEHQQDEVISSKWDRYQIISPKDFQVDPILDPFSDGYIFNRKTRFLTSTMPWDNVKETFNIRNFTVFSDKDMVLSKYGSLCNNPEALMDMVSHAVLCTPKKYYVFGTSGETMKALFSSIFGSHWINKRVSINEDSESLVVIHCVDELGDGVIELKISIPEITAETARILYSSAFSHD